MRNRSSIIKQFLTVAGIPSTYGAFLPAYIDYDPLVTDRMHVRVVHKTAISFWVNIHNIGEVE